MRGVLSKTVVIALVVIFVQDVHARPDMRKLRIKDDSPPNSEGYDVKFRREIQSYDQGEVENVKIVKRVSDQRLAELETQLALSKMQGQLVTIPIGFGKLDPTKVGRKRRSQSRIFDTLLKRSSDLDGIPEPALYLYYDDMYRRKR